MAVAKVVFRGMADLN